MDGRSPLHGQKRERGIYVMKMMQVLTKALSIIYFDRSRTRDFDRKKIQKSTDLLVR